MLTSEVPGNATLPPTSAPISQVGAEVILNFAMVFNVITSSRYIITSSFLELRLLVASTNTGRIYSFTSLRGYSRLVMGVGKIWRFADYFVYDTTRTRIHYTHYCAQNGVAFSIKYISLNINIQALMIYFEFCCFWKCIYFCQQIFCDTYHYCTKLILMNLHVKWQFWRIIFGIIFLQMRFLWIVTACYMPYKKV